MGRLSRGSAPFTPSVRGSSHGGVLGILCNTERRTLKGSGSRESADPCRRDESPRSGLTGFYRIPVLLVV